jgi:hypothetical protein
VRVISCGSSFSFKSNYFPRINVTTSSQENFTLNREELSICINPYLHYKHDKGFRWKSTYSISMAICTNKRTSSTSCTSSSMENACNLGCHKLLYMPVSHTNVVLEMEKSVFLFVFGCH